FTTFFDADPFHYARAEVMALAGPLGLAVEFIGDWGHPRAQRMACFRLGGQHVASGGTRLCAGPPIVRRGGGTSRPRPTLQSRAARAGRTKPTRTNGWAWGLWGNGGPGQSSRFASAMLLIFSPSRATSNGFLKTSLKPYWPSCSGAASSSLARPTISVPVYDSSLRRFETIWIASLRPSPRSMMIVSGWKLPARMPASN